MGTFIQILDTSIANVSIPYIAGGLGVSPNEGTWVITSFAVSNAIILPLTGWLSGRVGEVRLFIWSTVLFSITSWLCGLAWSYPALLMFRVLQGAAGGALIPLSQGLMLQCYPAEKKGVAIGIWAMVVIVAPILGPVLGGYLTENYGWRWIFYINIPLGFMSAWLTWALMGTKEDETSKEPIDYVGFFLLLIAVGCFQIFLDKGQNLDWFNSSSIIVLLLTAGIAFAFFVPWNYMSAYPVVDFSFFTIRNFTLGVIITSTAYLVFFGTVVILPLWLQLYMGYTAYWAGIAIAPIGVVPLFLSVLVGKAVNFFDARWMLTISFLIFWFTFLWYSRFTTEVDFFAIVEPRFIQGFAIALFFIPLIHISLEDIPPAKISSASGVFNFIRIIAGSGAGTSLYVTFWERRTILHHSQLTETLTRENSITGRALDGFQDLGVTRQAADLLLDLQVQNQSAMLAINDMFWFSAWFFMALIALVWCCKKSALKSSKTIAVEAA
jgi:DHA2 family multidrug resistance protein